MDALTNITVAGFKSLVEERSVDVRPLTVLAGANSSGKSSLVQPLLLMKQTMESRFDPGPLLLKGPNAAFTTADQFLSSLNGKRAESFSVGFKAENGLAVRNLFSRKASEPLSLSQSIYETPKRGTLKLSKGEGISDDSDLVHLIESAFGVSLDLASRLLDEFKEVSVNRCFLGFPEGTFAQSLIEIWSLSDLTTLLTSIIHVPGLRDIPQRTYPRSSAGPAFEGIFSPYAASVIYDWRKSKSPQLKSLNEDLATLQLTRGVVSEPVNESELAVKVDRLPTTAKGRKRHSVDIADVGFGLSQCLPVLVALNAAQPNQTVYLEQPEIHLHPRAQANLASVLVKAAKRGVRVIAETHSEILLIALQAQVAQEKISPDEVALHWFQRRPDGITDIFTAELDESGSYGDWPVDFADVSLEWQSRYLDAADLVKSAS